MSRKKSGGQDGPSVPAYIVTFSDMVTLLLTFFVLLLSMAEDNNPEKFRLGQESFRRSLANFGLRGILYTLSTNNNYSEDMINYPIDEDEEKQLTPTNAHEEKLRRLFNKINDNMEVRPSQIKGRLTDLITPAINFGSTSDNLTQKHESILSEICSELTLSDQKYTIYVVGLAPDKWGDDKWIIASKRGAAVAEYMYKKLGSGFKIHSWGTADASDWLISSSSSTIESDIIIVILQ